MQDNENKVSPEVLMEKKPQYMTAHRGCRNETNEQGNKVVENTGEAFRIGIEAGANCVETDFRLIPGSGELVTCHGIEPHKHTLESWTKENPGSMTIGEVATWARAINEINPDNKVSWLWEIKDTETDMFKVMELIFEHGLENEVRIISRHQSVIQEAMLAQYAMGIEQTVNTVLLVPEATVLTSEQILNKTREIETIYEGGTYKTDVAPLFPKGFRPSQDMQKSLLQIETLYIVAAKHGVKVFTDALRGKPDDLATINLLKTMVNEGAVAVTVDHPRILQKAFGVEPGKRVIPELPNIVDRKYKSSLNHDYRSSGFRKSDQDTEHINETHRKYLRLVDERGIKKHGPIMGAIRSLDMFLSAQ